MHYKISDICLPIILKHFIDQINYLLEEMRELKQQLLSEEYQSGFDGLKRKEGKSHCYCF